MKGSNFVFDCVPLLYCKCHKINFIRGGSNIDSPEWIKKLKAKINHINKKDNKCFQYAITAALNHKEIGKHPEKKIKLFVNKHHQEGINYSSEKDDWNKFEKNNLTISLNVMCAKKNISCLYFKT